MVLAACSQQETPDDFTIEDSVEISSEKIEVPDVVLEIAEQYVEQKYIIQNEKILIGVTIIVIGELSR